jgi:hypothetical protein
MLMSREPLSQIAVACGFADQAHLARLFRREMGSAPSQWRRVNLHDGNGGKVIHAYFSGKPGVAVAGSIAEPDKALRLKKC